MREDSHGPAMLAWFLAGAACGAAAALLLAPQSGTETREVLRRRASEGATRVRDTSRQAYERGRDLYEKGRHAAEDAGQWVERNVERGRDKVGEVRERFRSSDDAGEDAAEA